MQNVLAEYNSQPDPGLTALDDISLDEWDILGFIYQCMQKEGEKNINCKLQNMIYQCYQLTAEEITYIKSCL